MYKKCKYCHQPIEFHHVTNHTSRCYLRPSNLKKIANFIKSGIIDNRQFRRAMFYDWATEQNILTSITIANRMGLKNWKEALLQLCIFAYLGGHIEFEYVEVIISCLSSESMFLESDIWKQLKVENYENKLKLHSIDTADLYQNLYYMIIYVVHRCNMDMMLEDGYANENREPTDVFDACEFMCKFAPEIVESRIKKGLYSDDALNFITEILLEEQH